MPYANVHFTSRDRGRRWRWELDGSDVTVRVASADERTRVTLDFASAEAVDEAIGVLMQARNALADRRYGDEQFAAAVGRFTGEEPEVPA